MLARLRSGITTRWNGPGMLWKKQEIIELSVLELGFEGATLGRSLVPAAQAQAARSR